MAIYIYIYEAVSATLLRIRDGYPRSGFLSILNPGSNNRTKRGGKFFCPTIFYSHKYNKIVNILNFEQLKEFFCHNTKN